MLSVDVAVVLAEMCYWLVEAAQMPEFRNLVASAVAAVVAMSFAAVVAGAVVDSFVHFSPRAGFPP